MVMRYCPDTPILLVEGSEAMMKVTYREDFMRAETWLELHPEHFEPTMGVVGTHTDKRSDKQHQYRQRK